MEKGWENPNFIPTREYLETSIKPAVEAGIPRDEAERIAGSDPFTAAGGCNFELIEWNVHQIMGVGPFSQAELGASPSNRH